MQGFSALDVCGAFLFGGMAGVAATALGRWMLEKIEEKMAEQIAKDYMKINGRRYPDFWGHDN